MIVPAIDFRIWVVLFLCDLITKFVKPDYRRTPERAQKIRVPQWLTDDWLTVGLPARTQASCASMHSILIM